ncbi:MAG TPA: amidohydrolase family protein [Armatimonadota bacterium]|nr:amidohydrolase family protein [Armatimonadota bacterium]
MHELKIVGGSVIDGSGAEPRECEIAVDSGRVTEVGPDVGPSDRLINAAGMYVSPGFIDPHSHACHEGLGSILHAPTAPSAVLQGVTSIVTGMCGYSPLEIGHHLDAVAENQTALNYCLAIGHNSIRRHVMDHRASAPTAGELDSMKALTAAGMRQGAVGLSSGLWYVPGAYAEIDEVAELAKVAAEHGGIYASHVRSEDAETGPAALDEAIEIGRRAHIPVQIAHLKAAERPAWGQGSERLAILERARADGVDVQADAYPYTASATNLNVMLPPEAFEGDGLAAKLDDAAMVSKFREHMEARLDRIGGTDRVLITAAYLSNAVGRRLNEVAEDVGLDAYDVVVDLILGGPTSAIYFVMDQADVDTIVTNPLVMIGSDSSVRRVGEGMCHPRTWGTFPKVLARYARELGTLSWGQAVAKMTGQSAAQFGLVDRGVLREGAWADVVIFDPKAIADHAAYDDPHQAPSGVRQVLVNGETVALDGLVTGALPGHVIRGRVAD